MTNAALVAKLESAKEGSRTFSDEVLTALGCRRSCGTWYYPDGSSRRGPPDPTRNLQDAVDLVPEGQGWGVDVADLIEAWVGQGDDEDAWGHGRTAALSLSIAILKAVEAKDG